MLMRKTGLILATLAGALMVMACGGKGYGTTAPPQTDNTVAATPSLTFTSRVLGVNVRDGVAATVLSVWGGAVVPYPLPPHAITINAPARVARMSPVLRINMCVSVWV